MLRDDIFVNKWQPSAPRPPVCISDIPSKINLYDNYSNTYSTF